VACFKPDSEDEEDSAGSLSSAASWDDDVWAMGVWVVAWFVAAKAVLCWGEAVDGWQGGCSFMMECRGRRDDAEEAAICAALIICHMLYVCIDNI
jgi:hypothetical protein